MIAGLMKAWAVIGRQLLRDKSSGVPYILAQSAVPVILAPNGTVAANGTITLGTALPTIYSGGAWVRLPAGAVVGGSAGLYWTVFSSTTVGVVYTNFVDPSSQFIPYIPTGNLVAATGSNAAYTQATTTITLANITIPAGAMGLNGGIRLMELASVPSNANAKVLEPKLGNTQIGYLSASSLSSMALQNTCLNRGVANAQVSSRGVSGSGSPIHVASVNTAADSSLSLTGQMAVATDYFILDGFTVEVLPA